MVAGESASWCKIALAPAITILIIISIPPDPTLSKIHFLSLPSIYSRFSLSLSLSSYHSATRRTPVSLSLPLYTSVCMCAPQFRPPLPSPPPHPHHPAHDCAGGREFLIQLSKIGRAGRKKDVFSLGLLAGDCDKAAARVPEKQGTAAKRCDQGSGGKEQTDRTRRQNSRHRTQSSRSSSSGGNRNRNRRRRRAWVDCVHERIMSESQAAPLFDQSRTAEGCRRQEEAVEERGFCRPPVLLICPLRLIVSLF